MRSPMMRERKQQAMCHGSIQCVGRLFGQTPESLVETDPAVDAAQGTQSSESSKAVPSAVGDTTAHEAFLHLCGVVSYVELFVKAFVFSVSREFFST